MRNFKLTIEYIGTRFAGWQFQTNARSVQGAVEEALSRIFGQPVPIVGSGRTDAGVHALGQVANFRLDTPIRTWRLWRALDHHLPEDISIRDVEEVPYEFHSRMDAIGKHYRYQVLPSYIRRAWLTPYAWTVPPKLDYERLAACLPYFLGEHDFTSFRGAGCTANTSVRTITRSEVRREGDLWVMEFEGSGFLRYQVRSMVGTAVEVSRKGLPPERIAEILAAQNRLAAGMTAPAQGLFLVEVFYP